MKINGLGIALVMIVLSPASLARTTHLGRFFFEGDGAIHLVNDKTGQGGKALYRDPTGEDDPKGIRQINRLCGISSQSSEEVSLRLVALLDYLEDHFRKGPVHLLSCYRSPTYNKNLRKKGALAAKTSLHIEGMAADIAIDGLPAEDLWRFVQSKGCCGVGFYHGRSVHVDTGPARSWDEKSSGVEKDLGASNRLILLRTDRDIYRPGETVQMRLARITDYPIGVSRQATITAGGGRPRAIHLDGGETECVPVRDRKEARSLTWTIPPATVAHQRAQISLSFCDRPTEEMPREVESNPILIR